MASEMTETNSLSPRDQRFLAQVEREPPGKYLVGAWVWFALSAVALVAYVVAVIWGTRERELISTAGFCLIAGGLFLEKARACRIIRYLRGANENDALA